MRCYLNTDSKQEKKKRKKKKIFDYRARCDHGGNQQKRKSDNHGEGSSKGVKKARVDPKTLTKKVEQKKKSGGRDWL